MVVLRLTLDTTCLADARAGKQDGQYVDRLIELARNRQVELWITSGLAIDQSAPKADPHRRDTLQWLKERPVLGPAAGPFRFNLSTFDGPDVFADGPAADADAKIQAILPPSEIKDVHHLSAHAMSSNDAFVTRDRKVLDRRQRLLQEVGIEVLTAAEAVTRVESSLRP